MVTLPPPSQLCILGLLLSIFCVYQNHLWIFSIDAQLTPELEVIGFNKIPQVKDSQSSTSFLTIPSMVPGSAGPAALASPGSLTPDLLKQNLF